MRKLNFIIVALLAIMAFASCSDSVTYADQKKQERSAINRYIRNQNINWISEAKFKEQDCTTDTTKNEYVLFESTGVYMQIRCKGDGEKILPGKEATVLCRFKEYNLLEGDFALQLTNITQYTWKLDKMSVKNVSGTFTASFLKDESLMYSKYGSTAVPAGWLVPLSYVYLGRIMKGERKAVVRLIVPHTQGQSDASQNVYPCMYELYLERGK